MLETEIFAGITDLKNGKDLGTHKNIITAYNELNKHYPQLVKSYELLKGVEDYNIYGESITSITNIQEPNKIDYELVSYLDNNKNPVSKEQAVIIIIKGYTLNGRMVSHESFFVDNKLKTVTQEAYDETKHRRGGNSQNTGQFSSGGGGKLERKEKHKKPKFDSIPSGTPQHQTQMRVKMINEIKKFFKNIDTSKLLAEAEKSDSEWSSREKLGLQIDDTLANTFQNTRVMHRTKDTFSSMEKLARKPEIYKSIDDLHDRTGVRAICHNLQEVKDMIKYVEENYDIIKENDYLEGHTDGSGYRSYHCIIKDHNTGFEAEIQIRTENEDIWANVFHDLYKPHEVKIKQALKTNPDGIRKYANDYSKYLYNIDCCNKYGILPTLPQELIVAGFGYSKEVKSNPDFFDHILGEIEEMTPDHGFNIVIFDDYATDGEKLSLVGNYDTEQDANEIKSQCEAQGKITYIYTTDSIQESFVEQEHPRDTDGQFTTKGGGQTNSNNHDESGNHNKSINDDDWKGFDDKGGDKIKFIDIKNDNKHPEGDKIVTALKNNTPDNIKNNPKGSVFLSPDGEWLGSKTGSHNDTLIDSMKKSNISIGDNNDNLVPSAIKATGMMRVNAGQELSLDIAQPLTSSQRNTLQDYILTKNRTPDQIYIQVRGNMANMNTDIIKNSLFR